MRLVAIDFESDYDKAFSITTLGAWNYIHDEKFNAYMVSVATSDGLEWVGHPKDFDWGSIDGDVWLSHNASFDETVYRRLQGLYGLTAEPSQWYCTSNLAVYLQAPRSLAGAAKQLLDKFVDKSVRTKQSGVNQNTATDEDAEELREYALNDSRYCLQLWEKYGREQPEWERRLARLTYLWGNAGVHVDLERLHTGLSHLTVQRDAELGKLPWVRDNSGKPLSRSALIQECMKEGIKVPGSLAMDSPEAQKWEAMYADKYEWVDAVRNYRRINRLFKVCETLFNRCDEQGVFHYGLKYCAARPTARWGGSDGLNMQNLPRGEMFGVNVRECLVPAPGCSFIICDLAQIEVRTLAYLAGDSQYLGLMRKGLNPYEAAAQQLGIVSDARGLKARDPATYHMVKATVLGCGYGMGHMKFRTTAPILTGGKYCPTPDEAKKAVEKYRRSKPAVVGLWNEMGSLLRKANMKGEPLILTLPSGRELRYWDINRRGDSYALRVQRGGTHSYFHGPKVAENASQGFARDVFGDALLRIQDANLPGRIVFHVHDEVIFEVPTEKAEETAKALHQIMCTPPDWAKDLPVDAEYVVTDRYTK